MSDPTRPDWSDPTQAAGRGYPPNPDPAYSGQYPGYWGPPYSGPGYSAPMTQPTEQFPAYWPPGSGYPPPAPPPPPPKSPRWLWIAAAAAVLLVTGLVLALVIVSGSSQDSTVVAPTTQTTTATSPQTPVGTSPPSTRPAPTTPRVPITSTTRVPMPTATEEPSTSAPGETSQAPSGSETVVYSVTGQGRAINITYVDTGGVMQTEFNVALPWSKEVSLSAPAKGSASVAVVNVGRDVTCSISVSGSQVRQRTGRGLTICTGAA